MDFSSNDLVHSINTDYCQLEISLTRSEDDKVQISIRKMEPDRMEVGNNLEEALRLLKHHQELISKFNYKKTQIAESISRQLAVSNLHGLWSDIEKQLDLRLKLLDLSVKFHQSAQVFIEKVNRASRLFEDVSDSEVSNTDLGYALIEQHQRSKKEILESSLSTFEVGKELLAILKEMSLYSRGDTSGKHATSSACFSIENLLELLNSKRLKMEELWRQRKLKLEQCIQICYLKEEIKKTLEWIRNEGMKQLVDSKLGTNYQEAIELQENQLKFEKQFKKLLHDSVMKCIRTADQFIHTGLERADEAHSEAHVLLEEWEKFARKLDQRRKLLAIVVSFYKQTEQASERLIQIEREIKIEHEKKRHLDENNAGQRKASPSAEFAQRHADLSSKLAEISAPGLREGRIILEKCSTENSETNHVIKKVYEFTEHVNEIKSKLTNEFQNKLVQTFESDHESRKISEFMEFESKYNDMLSWITNIGEAFLTQHRDMGLDIVYVSDYVDNHEQMEIDLRQNEKEYQQIKEKAHFLMNECETSEEKSQIGKNLELIEQKWNRLRLTVEQRIAVASDYLDFIKIVAKFKNISIDLNELFKNLNDHLCQTSPRADSIFEQHVLDKSRIIEQYYEELLQKGRQSIASIRKSDNEILKLNSNHMVSDIELIVNDATNQIENIRSHMDIWKEKMSSQKRFKEEWQEFLINARQLIKKTILVEENFFPKVTGEFGNTLEMAQVYQQNLDEFMPTVKQISIDIEDCITKAEILSLNGDTQGQKDMIVNELTKIRQRFLARINEYKILLQMAIQFFQNYHKLEEIITESEQKCSKSDLPNDITTAENMLKDHVLEREHVIKLLNFTSGEGDEIVYRVRRQGVEADTSDAVRRLLTRTEEHKRSWERVWEEKQRALKKKLELCQVMIEKNQIVRDLDMMLNEIARKRSSIGHSYELVQKDLKIFDQFTENMNICSENISKWKKVVENILENLTINNLDGSQEKELNLSLRELDDKWSSLNQSLKDYHNLLLQANEFYKMYEDLDIWTQQKTQLVNRLVVTRTELYDPKQIEFVLDQIDQNLNDIKEYYDSKVKYLTNLAVEIYGDLDGPSRVRHVVTKNVDLMNNLLQLKEDVENIRDKNAQKIKTSQIYHESSVLDDQIAPNFTKKLESAVVINGSQYLFECIAEGTLPFEVSWFKNGTQIENGQDFSVSSSDYNLSLLIKSTKMDDNALFSCRIVNDMGMAETSAFLKVKEQSKPKGSAPFVVSPLESVQLNAESNYTLECIISGEPEPEVVWYKDQVALDSLPESVTSSLRTSKFMNVRQLTISNANPDLHNGSYTCLARNQYGEANCGCGILVRRPIIRTIPVNSNRAPVIEQPLLPQYTVQEGKPISMSCRYSAFPRVDILWLRDNQPIDLNLMGLSKDFKIVIDVDSTSLEISEAYPDDSGQYSVVIRNDMGQARSSTQLFVKENSEETEQNLQDKIPNVLRHLKNVETKQGSQVKLELFAIGQPRPNIKWFKNDEEIGDTDQMRVQQDDNKYCLTIDSCKPEDSGEYKAILINNFGQSRSQCRLNVLSNEIENKPVFVEVLKDISVSEGHDVCFKCKVTGFPQPVITWFRNATQLEESSRVKMARQGDDYYLVVTESVSEDSGIIQAQASNTYGETSSYGRLTVSQSKQQPYDTHSHSISVTQTKKTGQPPQFNKLFYNKHVRIGEDLRIEAIITGSPKPNVKWMFNEQTPQIDNCRCVMAGDSYSFVIERFEEKNLGCYSITAENEYGTATCSAEILFEGDEFRVMSGGLYTQEELRTTTYKDQEFKATDSKCTETMAEIRDTGSQIDMADEWSRASRMHHEFGESAPFVVNAHSAYSSSSYTQKSNLVDYSTTLIKDVAPHYEPIELIINRDQSMYGSGLHSSSSTYVREINESKHFEPVNLIFHKPVFHRAGSLPPVYTRQIHYGYVDTDDEYFVDRGMDSKMTYYKQIDRRHSRPSFFKPVELIIDASSLTSDSQCGKRYRRDVSLPAKRTSRSSNVSCRKKIVNNSSFVYDDCVNDYDSTSSDFVSDRDSRDSRYVKYSYSNQSTGSRAYQYDDQIVREIKVEQKLPSMEMTIDLKAPPKIERQIRNVSVCEGQTARLECILNAKPQPNVKWYREGIEIEENQNVSVSYDQNSGLATLIIRYVTYQDSAKYTCVARNALGSCSSSAMLHVKGPHGLKSPKPKSEHAPQNALADPFYTSQLNKSCRTSTMLVPDQGHVPSLTPVHSQKSMHSHQNIIPKKSHLSPISPKQTRSKSSEETVPHRQESIKNLSKNFEPVSQPAQNSSYSFTKTTTRTVYNTTPQWSQAKEDSRPIVEEPVSPDPVQNKHHRIEDYIPNDEDQSEPRLLRRLPYLIKKKEGQPVKLEIEVSGTPDPRVEWYKDNNKINNSPDTRLTQNDHQHTLVIPEAFCEDSGLYKALITSPVSNTHLETACQLVVEGQQMSPPRSHSDSPMHRRYQVEHEEVRIERQEPIEVQKPRIESVHRNYLSQAEVKPKQDMVKMLPASEPRKSSSSKPITIQPVQKPHFKKHLQNTTAQQGHPVTLNCIIQSTPDIEIKWYSNGHLIQPSTDITISFDPDTGDCTLRIVEVYPEDSGQYTVVATNPAGSESSTCWLIVKEPSAHRNEVTQPMESGKRRSVSSRPSDSRPTPLNLGAIKSSRVEPTEAKPVEIIRAYQKYPDTGIPKVIEHLKDVNLIEGGQALFECRFDGHPLKIQWYKGDREITNQFRHKMSFDDKTGIARLCISTVLEDDADVYICRAYNELGEAFTKAGLVPLEKPAERPRQSAGQDEVFDRPQPVEMNAPQPAKIIRGLKPEQVKENDCIVLKALIAGNPLPSISWYKNNAPLVMSARHSTHFDEMKKLCSLKIKNAKPDDAGLYTLVVQNPYGSDQTSGPVSLCVPEERARHSSSVPSSPMTQPMVQKAEPKPEELRAPRIIKKMQPETTVNEDQAILLSCMIEPGNPLANIVFLKNDKPLNASSRIKTSFNASNGVASIRIEDSNVYDSGTYKIRAENLAGKAETGGVVYINKLAGIDTRPVVDPDAFKYLPQPVHKPVEPAKPKTSHSSQPIHRPSYGDQPTEPMTPPNFVVGLPANSKMHEGETIKLSCQVEGNPKPSIHWLKDGNSLPSSLRFNTNYVVPTGLATLTVTGALQIDCGNYTAVAENPAGKAYTTSQVFIKESSGVDTSAISNPDAFKYLNRPQTHGKYESAEDSQTDDDVPLNRAKPPRVIHHLQNIKQLEGEPVTMACKIDGFPKPSLTWLRDGQPLTASTRFTTTYDLNTGVARLKISDSILNDSATYTVVGENKAGSDRTHGRLDIEKESGVDSKPIVDPNAFAYLNKPQSASPANVDENGEAFSPARVLLPLSNIHSTEGKAVRLACRVDGNPKPSVVWYKNGIALPASTRLNPTFDFKTQVVSLKIDEAQTNDSGVYQVFVENDYGNDRTESRLLVDISAGIDQSPIVDPGAFKYLDAPKPSERPQLTDQDGNKYSAPKVIVPLKDIRVNHGQPATFLSKIVGCPIPSITWLLNNKPLSESSRYTSAYDHTTGLASFKINGTQSNDLATYTAIAENCVGRDSTTASLHLNQVSLVDTQPIVSPDAFRYLEKAALAKSEPDEMPGQLKPPKFVVPLKNVSVEEGECATLLAKIDAYPYPSIQWFRNGISLPASTRTLPNYDFNTGLVSLRISDVQLADFGNYTALAQNKIGQDQTQCCLLVKELPGVDSSSMVSPEAFRYLEKPRGQARPLEQSVAYIPPKFIVPLSNVSLEEGQTIYLAGKVQGYPKPKITWFKDGTPVPASTRFTIDFDFSTGVVSLRISDAQTNDIGIFIALAENEAGSDQTQCEVTIQSMPNIDSTPMVNPEAFKYLEQSSYARPKSVDELDELSPPKVIVPLSNVKLEEGQTVILACKIEGYPRPKLTWFKNGLTLPAANRYTTDYDLSTNIATLKIDQALLIDLGDYLVLAENPAGRDQTHCTVFVQQLPNVDSTPMVDPEAFKYLEQAPLRKLSLEDVEDNCPPIVIIPLQDIKLTEGEPVMLMSKIDGKPKPKLTWFKNDEPIMASQRCDMDYNLSTCIATLNIKVTKPVDIGVYKVEAENVAGKCETSCQLFIEAVPNIDETAYVNPESFRPLEAFDKPPASYDSDDGEKQPVLIVRPLEDIECFEGESVTFVCEVKGYPKPQVEWTRENQPLPHALRLSCDYLINEGRALFNIDNVKLDDQATYTLTARNSSGVASTSAKLKVKTVATIDDTSYVNPDVFEQFEMKKKPNWNQPIDNADNARLKIIEPLKDFRLVEGSQAVFSCTIDAYPKPEIHWFKDDQPLMASQRYATYYDMNMGIVTLIIKSALLDDQGEYKCVVSNIAGTEDTQAKLSVDFVPNIDETSYINPNALRHLQPAEQGQQPDDDDKYKKPYFVKVPKNSEVTDGSTVRLDCLAFGRPTPTLTWYFNDQELPEDPAHKCLVNEEGVNSLLISPASFADTGTYKCVARNKVGEASFTVDLKVVDKDALIAPYFIEHLNNIVIPEGKDTSLSCTCSGTPVPTLTWQKDAKVLTPDQEYRIDINGGHSKLYIQNAQKSDQGWYQCTAISPAGSTITRTKVTVLPPGAVQTMAPDLTKLIKQPVEAEVPGFVTALHKLKHVQPNKSGDERPKSPSDMPMGHNFGSIWSKDELQDEETIYNKDKPIPPKFKTHFKASLNLRERDPTRFEAKLIPIGDPTMTLQWLRNGEPLRSASRYVIKYDFGLVSLDLLWTYPEDDGVYECVATNSCGQDKTRAELKCKGNRSIIYDTQLPDGMEGYLKLQEMEEKIKIASILREEQPEDEAPEPCAPEIIMHLEDDRVDEGTMAKFMVKVTGYPKPRVSWFVNKTHCVTGSRFKLYFDGMIHYLDILKVSKADEGLVRVFAKNINGEIESSAQLKVNPKQDYRSVLRSSKTGEPVYVPEELKQETSTELSSEERKVLDRLPLLKPFPKQQKPADTRFAPKFNKQLEPFKVTEGVVVLLSVEFLASPNPEAIWYKDGFQMQSSEDFFIEATATKSSLRIREAYKSDSGMYQVKIFNEVGIAQTKAYLTVTPADLDDLTPTILMDIKSVTCNSGDPVKFQSQAVGNPHPIISWYKDDEKLEMSQRIKEFTENDAYTLLIMESIAADSGCYELVAENAYGKVYTRAYLTVLGDKQVGEPEPIEVKYDDNNVRSVPLSSKFSQPVIQEPLKDQTVTEGQSANFECIISNSEQATVEWFKEDKRIKQSKYFNMVSTGDKHQLKILEAFAEDEGLYKCAVSNPAGKTSSSAHLKIIHLTEAPVFVKTIDNAEVDENKPAEFGVQLKPDNQAQIEWSHNGVLVKEGINFQTENPSPGVYLLNLKQARPKDAGTYTCKAHNSAGTIKCSAQLIIKNLVAINTQASAIARFNKGSTPRIEFYFDNAHCKKQIHQFDFTEINLYFNGTKISQSHKYNISRHKDLIILSINRLNITECGLYSIEVMGKNARHIASLNIELTNEKIENAVNQYDFVQSESKWILKDRVQKTSQKETSSIHIATPLMDKYTTTCGKDFKFQINFKSDLQHTVNWYSNNELIINNSKFEIINSQNTTCLLIKSIDQTDQKEYKVEIKNEKDSVMYKTFLSVQQGTKFLSELKPVEKKSEVIIKPVIVKQLEPLVHGQVGKETKLTCHFKSTKTEKIDWFFNQININDKINNQKEKYELKSTSEETSLVIKNINVKDMGDYSCCVYNSSGKCRSVCHLDVVEAPRRITKPFKKQKSDVQNITDSYEKKDILEEEKTSSLLKEPEQKSSSIQEIKAEEVVEKDKSLKSDDSSEAETVILADISTSDELKLDDKTQVQKYPLEINDSEIQPDLIFESLEKEIAPVYEKILNDEKEEGQIIQVQEQDNKEELNPVNEEEKKVELKIKPLEEKKTVLVEKIQFEEQKTELENVISKDEEKILEIKPDYEESNESLVEEIKKEKVETLLPVEVEEVLTSQLEPKVQMLVAEESKLDIRPVEVEEIAEKVETMEEPKEEVLEQEKVLKMEEPKEEVMQEEQVLKMEEPKEEVMQKEQVLSIEEPIEEVLKEEQVLKMEEPKEEVMQEEQVLKMEEPKEEVMQEEQVLKMEEPKEEVLQEELMDKVEPIIVIETEESLKEEILPIHQNDIIEQVQSQEQLEKEIIQISDDLKDEKEQIQEVLIVEKHKETIPVADLANEIKKETKEDKIESLQEENAEGIAVVQEEFQITTDLDSFLETKNEKPETELSKKTPFEQKNLIQNIHVTEQPLQDIKPIQEDIKVELAIENIEQVENEMLFDNIKQQDQDKIIPDEEKQEIEKDKIKEESYEKEITTIGLKDKLSVVEETKNEKEESLLPVEVEKVLAPKLEAENVESKEIHDFKEEAKEEMLVAEETKLNIRPVEVEEIVEQVLSMEEPKKEVLQEEQVQTIEEPKEQVLTMDEPKEQVLTMDEPKEQVLTMEEPKEQVLQEEEQIEIEPINNNEQLTENKREEMTEITNQLLEDSEENEKLALEEYPIDIVEVHLEPEQIKEMEPSEKSTEKLIPVEEIELKTENQEAELVFEVPDENEYIQKEKFSELKKEAQISEKITEETKEHHAVEEPESSIQKEEQMSFVYDQLVIDEPKVDLIENGFVIVNDIPELSDDQISEKPQKPDHKSDHLNVQITDENIFTDDFITEILSPKYDQTESLFDTTLPEPSKISMENLFFSNQPVRDELLEQMIYDLTETKCEPLPKSLSIKTEFTLTPVNTPEIGFKKPNFQLQKQDSFDQVSQQSEIKIDLKQSQDSLNKSDKLEAKTSSTESLSNLISELNQSIQVYKSQELSTGSADSLSQIANDDEVANKATKVAESITLEQTVDDLIDEYGNFRFKPSSKRPSLKKRRDSKLAPKFSQTLVDQQFKKDDNLHLDCYVEGEQPIKVEWFHNKTTLKPTKNIEIYRELGVCSLEIIKASQQTDGEFKCQASNKHGHDTTACILTMIDTETPVFSELLRDQCVELESEVFLDCTVKNKRPGYIIQWYVDEQKIVPTRNVEIFAELGICSLQIRKMSAQLQGFYCCKIHDANDAVIAQTGCRLTIKDEPFSLNLIKDEIKLSSSFKKIPFFVNELSSCVAIKEGDSLCLFCRLNTDCEPKPSIVWIKDGSVIKSGKYFDLMYNETSGECRLLADNCEKKKFEGTYTCVATFPNSQMDLISKTSCQVKIISYQEILEAESNLEDGLESDSINRGIPPMFLQALKDTVCEEGDDLELMCQIMGAPLPDVVCFFTKDITDKSAMKKVKQELLSYNCETGICRVFIKNVSFYTNDGFYIIKAVNDAGSLTTACQVKIKLKSCPLLNLESDVEPVFTTLLPSRISVMDGQEICLTCICSAKPEPNIEWLKSSLNDQETFSQVVFTNDIRSCFDSTTGKCTLKINDTYPQDAGTYKCIASNSLGQAETAARLAVETFVYEPDSEEASFNVDMSESDGTITPTSKKFETYSEYESDSISINKQLSQSLTGSEYFTANSGFTTDSAASSSIWK